jgi:hypothetical protein
MMLRWLADKLLGTPRPLSARAQIDLRGPAGGTIYRSSSAVRRLNRQLDDDGLRGLDEDPR